MKRYSDYMDEITPDELYKGLLKKRNVYRETSAHIHFGIIL